MRSAPPVLVPVGRFVWGGRIALLLAALTLGLGFVWLAQQATHAGARAALVLAWLALAGISAGCWRREVLPAGQLSWDGRAWWFQAHDQPEAQAVTVRVVWDGQSTLGLHVQGQGMAAPRGPSGFAWLRASDMPARWHGLRCAVHADDMRSPERRRPT